MQIDSTQLWVYKRKSLAKATMNVYLVDKKNHGNRKKLSTSSFRNTKSGWFAIELKTKKFVKETKIGKKYIDLTIDIECSKCRLSTKPNEQPFITLSAINKIEKRKRRDTDEKCSTKPSCCRLPLKIDFKFIGWDNWVMNPPAYDAYYCDGNCYNDDAFHYRHTGILKAIVAKTNRKDIKLCCTPRKYASLNMLYINGGNLIQRSVETMIVKECWCL